VNGWSNVIRLVGRDGRMAKPLITTLFSCGGGADLGAIAAGFEPCESLEYDPQIAEVHQANIGGKMHVMNILDANPLKFEKADLLHASTVCKQFSTANANRGEAQLDIDCAKKVAEFIQVLQPPFFTLENVEAYRRSKSFHIIVEMLYSQGYWVQYQVLNSADFSVPQSRRRLILMAVKGGFIPPLPPKQKHIGWYEAIADKVHDLPDSKLADWQLKALPNEIRESLLVPTGNTSFAIKESQEPSFTMTSAHGSRNVKAILIENTGARSDRPLQTRAADDPCWTLRAMGQDGHYHRANALLENAKIKALDIACLADLQSFPRWYKWSGKKSLDGKIIGNSVTPLMYQAIAGLLMLNLLRPTP
jgi:DNA (cytosine-5)-methyltransferase 1